MICLIALQCEANNWRKSCRVQLISFPFLSALSGARVFCLQNRQIDVYEVEKSNGLVSRVNTSAVALNRRFELCEVTNRATDTIIAFGAGANVSLHRMVGGHLEDICELNIQNVRLNMTLICGLQWVDDKLLVHASHVSPSIPVVEFDLRGNQFTINRELFPDSHLINIECWCSLEDKSCSSIADHSRSESIRLRPKDK